MLSWEKLEIRPPVVGEFKGYIDKAYNNVLYMFDKTLLKFELPAESFKHGTDSKVKLKGEHLIDSESTLKQTLILDSYLIVLHSSNIVTLYNKD